MSISESSAVQDALVASLSGLRQAPTSGELHLPHQRKISAGPSDMYVRQVQFAGAIGFGQVNSVYLPYTNMTVQGAYVVATVSARSSGTTANLVATQGWIGPNGTQLLYARTTASWSPQAEAIKWERLNKSGDDRVRSMYASNDLREAGRIDRAANEAQYIIPMDALVERVVKNLGPLNIHDPNSIELQLDLLPLNRILADGTPGGTFTLNKLELVMYGTREADVAARQMQAAFVLKGLKLVMNQPNYFSKGLASLTTSDTISYPALSGEITAIELLFRNTSTINSTTPGTVNPLSWIRQSDLDTTGKTISVGTPSDPNAWSGIAAQNYQARYMLHGQSYVGGTRFLSAESLNSTATQVVDVRNPTIIPISFAARESMGQLYGAFSGSVNVANNLQVGLTFGALFANTTIESLVYNRRVVLIQPTGVAAANEMGF